MFTKFDSVKTLKTLIKLAAVAITSPATVSVASSLYPTDSILRIVVSIDQQGKNATMAQRWLYAGLAWVAYFSLFVIALNHNEGTGGLTFRLTLGVMLVYASVEAGLLAGIKREGQADRDIFADWQVRRYARKLARKSAMADLESAARMRQIDREVVEKLYSLQKTRQTDQRLREIQSGKNSDSRILVETTNSTVPTNSLDKI
jgi:hypothetical protein